VRAMRTATTRHEVTSLSSSPMDRAATAKRYRRQAEELRTKADLTRDDNTRAQYAGMAEVYETLADTEERQYPTN
jgi:hypothetical protein